jgi:chromate transporter
LGVSHHPTFREALRFWLKLGFISFGGPAGQIAIMQSELVERRRWIGQERFLHALNFCMLLPGPEAQQLAIYCGWLLHRTWGGIVAGVLFVLPAAFLLWGLAWVYMTHGNVPWIAALFSGLKPAVLAIVVAAVLRIGGKALRNRVMWGVAAVAFGLLFSGMVPFPVVVLGALTTGLIGGRLAPHLFAPAGGGHGHGGGGAAKAPGGAVIDDAAESASVRPSWGRALKVALIGGGLWAAPLLAIGLWQGWDGTLARMGFFFSKAAMVTFGGAYAVLTYVGQQAVDNFGWLTAPQMLDGLALAETTPGPLIMVLQFVGFVGAWGQPGGLSPLMAATLGAALTTWVTFVPCFIWIFLGAPHIERLRSVKILSAALATVTAAVVGVVLNLAVWFGWHVIAPAGDWTQPDWFSLAVAALAFGALHRFKANMFAVIAACAALGLFWNAS